MNSAPAYLPAEQGAAWQGDDASQESRWLDSAGAPADADLELAVIDRDGPHCLVFPCRRGLEGWINAETGQRIDVHPTHWRPWPHR